MLWRAFVVSCQNALVSTPTRESEPDPARRSSVIPERSADDSDLGWGDRDGADRDEEFLRDRPPHWG